MPRYRYTVCWRDERNLQHLEEFWTEYVARLRAAFLRNDLWVRGWHEARNSVLVLCDRVAQGS